MAWGCHLLVLGPAGFLFCFVFFWGLESGWFGRGLECQTPRCVEGETRGKRKGARRLHVLAQRRAATTMLRTYESRYSAWIMAEGCLSTKKAIGHE